MQSFMSNDARPGKMRTNITVDDCFHAFPTNPPCFSQLASRQIFFQDNHSRFFNGPEMLRIYLLKQPQGFLKRYGPVFPFSRLTDNKLVGDSRLYPFPVLIDGFIYFRYPSAAHIIAECFSRRSGNERNSFLNNMAREGRQLRRLTKARGGNAEDDHKDGHDGAGNNPSLDSRNRTGGPASHGYQGLMNSPSCWEEIIMLIS